MRKPFKIASLSAALALASVCHAADKTPLISDLIISPSDQTSIPSLTEQSSMIKIADFVDQSFSLGQSINSRALEEFRIETLDAAFIKVHFDYFNLPKGAYVEVSNPAGTEKYTYSSEQKSAMTFDQNIGEDGIQSFGAMSITGSTAIVRLVKTKSAKWDSNIHGVEVSRYLEGYPQAVIDEIMANEESGLLSIGDGNTRSTCGINERQDAVCFANSNPTEFERTRPTARLVISGGGLCTAWRVGPTNRIFTNNHCIDSQGDVSGVEAWFNYQRTSCGSGAVDTTTKVSGNSLLRTDFTLDYTLFSVNNFASLSSFGYYGLDVRSPSNQERIYIPQHGAGNPKELAITSDQNSGNVCRIDVVSANGRGAGTDTGYFCDTIGGSSGSAVLAASSNKVIALHHFGGCTNQGVRIDRIWPQVASFFNNQVPDGDNGSPPPPPPPPPPGQCSFEDDFGSSQGWTIDGSSNCSTGTYVRTNPTQQSSGGVTTQVNGDSDGNGFAVFTATNTSAGNADVDGGVCSARSPAISVNQASVLSVDWFHGQRDTGDDSGDFYRLEYSTNGGSSYIPMVSIGDSRTTASWATATANIPAGANVVIRVNASDGPNGGDIIEGGIDNVSICSQ